MPAHLCTIRTPFKMSAFASEIQDIGNLDDRNIQEKVDAYWQQEFDIPYLTHMLERRQRLLSSMRSKSRGTIAKPLDQIYHETNHRNIALKVNREQLKMTIEDVVARQMYVGQMRCKLRCCKVLRYSMQRLKLEFTHSYIV